MRITNAMMTNTTLMHINRNMRQLDQVIRQIETGKRVNRPSDNPLVASRALQFRTSVHENEQFRTNVGQGVAWMNVSESTFTNINSKLIAELRNLVVQGANTTYTMEQRQIIAEQMGSLFDEIKAQINQTFAGQYLFSGFRTNEPPVFREDNNRHFIITQNFNVTDISRERSWQRLQNPANNNLITPVSEYVSVLKLAFSEIGTPALTAANPFWDAPDGISVPGFHVRKVSINDEQAYRPPAMSDDLVPAVMPPLPVLHLIAETGELVMNSDTASAFPREGVAVTFEKQGFRKGELNPSVYFTSREIITDAAGASLITMNAVNRVYEITQYVSRACGTQVGANFTFTLAPAPMGAPPPGLMPMLNGRPLADWPGVTIAGNVVTIPDDFFDRHTNVAITFNHEIPAPSAVASEALMRNEELHGVRLVRALAAAGLPGFEVGQSVPLNQVCGHMSFDMHNQDIQYEFATRTLVTVNSLAKNVLTDKMFADFRRFLAFVEGVQITPEHELRAHFVAQGVAEEDLDNAVAEALIFERGKVNTALHIQFDNMLFLIDKHATVSTREQTNLGSRMVRLELIQDRLEQDYVTYERLVSDNENTDLIRASILRMSKEAAFMGSLRANSGIIQMTLANFLR